MGAGVGRAGVYEASGKYEAYFWVWTGNQYEHPSPFVALQTRVTHHGTFCVQASSFLTARVAKVGSQDQVTDLSLELRL